MLETSTFTKGAVWTVMESDMAALFVWCFHSCCVFTERERKKKKFREVFHTKMRILSGWGGVGGLQEFRFLMRSQMKKLTLASKRFSSFGKSLLFVVRFCDWNSLTSVENQ